MKWWTGYTLNLNYYMIHHIPNSWCEVTHNSHVNLFTQPFDLNFVLWSAFQFFISYFCLILYLWPYHLKPSTFSSLSSYMQKENQAFIVVFFSPTLTFSFLALPTHFIFYIYCKLQYNFVGRAKSIKTWACFLYFHKVFQSIELV